MDFQKAIFLQNVKYQYANIFFTCRVGVDGKSTIAGRNAKFGTELYQTLAVDCNFCVRHQSET
jgi:hypothetical protein